MSKRHETAEAVDQLADFERGGDGVFRHVTFIEVNETDDGDLWERSALSLLLLKSQIEKQLNAAAAASCQTRDIRELYGLKIVAERLNDDLDAIMRELDRRGALPPTVTVSVMN